MLVALDAGAPYTAGPLLPTGETEGGAREVCMSERW